MSDEIRLMPVDDHEIVRQGLKSLLVRREDLKVLGDLRPTTRG